VFLVCGSSGGSGVGIARLPAEQPVRHFVLLGVTCLRVRSFASCAVGVPNGRNSILRLAVAPLIDGWALPVCRFDGWPAAMLPDYYGVGTLRVKLDMVVSRLEPALATANFGCSDGGPPLGFLLGARRHDGLLTRWVFVQFAFRLWLAGVSQSCRLVG